MSSNLILRRLVLLGTQLVLAVVMLFHPSPYSDLAGELVPIAGWWTAIHTIQFVLFAFMGAAVWMLTSGLRGVAAIVSKVAAVVFALFYDIGDAVAGISTGILALNAVDAPAGKQAALVGAMETLFQSFTKNLMFTIGVNAWSVGFIVAVVTLFWAAAPRVPLFLIALPVYFMSFDHAFPFVALTFGSFFIVALWIEIVCPGPASDKEDPHPAAAPDPEAEAG